MRLKRLQQAMNRWPCQPQAIGQLADSKPARPAGQRLEDRRSPVDWLELILASTLVRSDMKTLLLTATALAVVCT